VLFGLQASSYCTVQTSAILTWGSFH